MIFDKLLPEGTSPAGHQNHLFRPVHPIRLIGIGIVLLVVINKKAKVRLAFRLGIILLPR